jgi:hypothetical protein
LIKPGDERRARLAIAQAEELVRRLKSGRGAGGISGAVALAQAEAALSRLREQQIEDAP